MTVKIKGLKQEHQESSDSSNLSFFSKRLIQQATTISAVKDCVYPPPILPVCQCHQYKHVSSGSK